MPRIIPYITILLSLLHHCWVLGEELSLEPKEGALLLKNQQVLTGKITLLGDYYHLMLGETGDIRIAKQDVQWHCADVQEIYARKVNQLPARSLEAHLALAEWCLRQKLPSQTAEQLVKAMAIQPRDTRIARLEERLKLACQPPPEIKAGQETSSATVGKEQLERTMQALPSGALERFMVVVQPLVMERCGGGSCHGGQADTRFQIVQPSTAKIPSRRFTQRNLFSVLELVDREQPNQSDFLKFARSAHGGAKNPPLLEAEERIYRQLEDWVNGLGPSHSAKNQARPATVSMQQLAGPQLQMDRNELSTKAAPLPEPNESTNSRSAESVDPFDPAPFNERFHGVAKP